MEDKEILDVDYFTFTKLKNLLNRRVERMEFLSVLPSDLFDTDARNELEETSSPGDWLLKHLGKQQVRVSEFIQWFEAAGLDMGLIILEHDVPLKITKQPPTSIKLKRGENLCITCEATSFPHPEYQWFKGKIELLEQQFSTFRISSVKVEDSGFYYCQVSKRSVDNNWSSESSNTVNVQVTIPEGGSFQSGIDRSSYSQFVNISNSEDVAENISSLDSKNLQYEHIQILRSPPPYTKVPQGSRLTFECIADHPGEIKYQWYKNGRILKDSVDSKLHLDDMFPDPHTGETKFRYQCEISNDYERILCDPAVVELEELNDQTQFYAEDKIAFLIGNDSYEFKGYKPLKTPEADITDLVALLNEIHFKVFAFKNLTCKEMFKVLSVFFSMISENSYALFFYAGHGFEHQGQTYLQPVDCSYDRTEEETVSVKYILEKMQAKTPALNVLLIDACRTNLGRKESWRVYEKAHMKNNTVFGYSTAGLSSSYEDVNERNSFFVKHLKKYIAQDKNIEDVISLVKKGFEVEKRSVKGFQNPVIESSLTAPRKLRDSYRSLEAFKRNRFQDKKIRRQHIKFDECSEFKCVFIIENKKMDAFFNGIELSVYALDVISSNFITLDNVEINLKFPLLGLQVSPTKGLRLTNFKHNTKNFLFKKDVIGIQKLCESKMLEGELEITLDPHLPYKHYLGVSVSVGETWTYFESIVHEKRMHYKE